MNLNLDVLKTEIREYLASADFIVFHGLSRTLDALPIVMWDTEGHPDYKEFLAAARASGNKMIVMHAREFSVDFVDSALDDLAEMGMPADEARDIQRRLRNMRSYDGFTCAIELSFDFGGRAYIYELRTDWYNEFSDLLAEIGPFGDEDDDDADEGSIGGYYSKN